MKGRQIEQFSLQWITKTDCRYSARQKCASVNLIHAPAPLPHLLQSFSYELFFHGIFKAPLPQAEPEQSSNKSTRAKVAHSQTLEVFASSRRGENTNLTSLLARRKVVFLSWQVLLAQSYFGRMVSSVLTHNIFLMQWKFVEREASSYKAVFLHGWGGWLPFDVHLGNKKAWWDSIAGW